MRGCEKETTVESWCSSHIFVESKKEERNLFMVRSWGKINVKNNCVNEGEKNEWRAKNVTTFKKGILINKKKEKESQLREPRI